MPLPCRHLRPASITLHFERVDHHRHARDVRLGGDQVQELASSPLRNRAPVRGLVLVGRGTGAKALSALKPGDKARVTWELRREPEVAISGNKVLLLGGVRRVVDDLEMHPRTAIGIDKDTGQVLMLVVDGRQDFSRGIRWSSWRT